MKMFALFISMLIASLSIAQMRPIKKVYIVEGVVADRETLKAIPSAILYNDSLGITTTSDETGYFKIVVPNELIKDRQSIPIDIVKIGYKRDGSGLTYNPTADTFKANTNQRVIWNYDVKIFWLAKNESELSSTAGAYARAKERVYTASIIRRTFDEAVASELREEKFDKLKEGNEKVYFQLGDEIGLATGRNDIIVVGKLTHVYVDGKKVMLTDLNNVVRRSKFFYDRNTSDELSKKFGKETLAFATSPTSNSPVNNSIKATLVIEINN